MAYHIAVGIVDYNEIILLCIDGINQLVFHFVCTHFRLQVVSSYLRRRNQDTVFAIERSFTTTIEEESYVRIFLGLGNVKLSLSVLRQIFAQRICHIFFREQDMNALERSIIRSHTVILQARNSLHAFFRHILLGQYDSQLFRTVVAVIEENHYIAFFNRTVEVGIVNRFDELIGYAFIV